MMISISGLVSTAGSKTAGPRWCPGRYGLIFSDERQARCEHRCRSLAALISRTREGGRRIRLRLDLVEPAASGPGYLAGPGRLCLRDLEHRAWNGGAADLSAPCHGHGPDGGDPRRALG